MADKCAHVNDDGSRCKAWSLRDGPFCFMHTGDNAKKAGIKGGYTAGYKALPPTELPDIEPDSEEDAVIPVLQRAVAQMEGMKPSPETMRALTAAASALDRAIERRANRGADVTRIEVVYVNDWRAAT